MGLLSEPSDTGPNFKLLPGLGVLSLRHRTLWSLTTLTTPLAGFANTPPPSIVSDPEGKTLGKGERIVSEVSMWFRWKRNYDEHCHGNFQSPLTTGF